MKSLLGTVLNKSPVKFPIQGTFGPGSNAVAGNPETFMRAMGAVSTLFAIVDRLATATARPTWHLMRAGTEVELKSHPCIDLWNHPNDFYTQNDFIEAVQQHMDLVGEQWWLVARSKLGIGPPLELWPVRPDRMSPVPDADNFISGYIYNNGAEKVPLDISDVLSTKKQNPLDPYRGMGPVQTLMADLDAEKYTAAWNANFFRNSALPGGIIEVDRILDDGQFEELLLRWREQHQGVANAARVAILEKGMTFNEMKYTQRDMQFQQLRQMNQEIIAMAFGFPMHMLGVTKDVNRANAETQEVMFQRWLIVPRLERIKQVLNTKLLPLYGTAGQGLEWDYDNPVPEDKKGDSEILMAAASAVKTLIDAGFEPEEVLETCHLPPMTFKEPPPPVVMAPGGGPPGSGDLEPGQPLEPGQSMEPKGGKGEASAEMVRRIMNLVRDDSKREMTAGWEDRLNKQRTALEKFLEKRWD